MEAVSLGRCIVCELARQGARIVVASRHPEQARDLKPMGEIGQIVMIKADTRDEASVVRAVEGARFVIHLPGILVEHGQQTFTNIHVEGPCRVARAARTAGAESLIHLSAIGADAHSPSAYGRSKAAGEAKLREAFPQAVILRPSLVFGHEDMLFNRFATMARLLPVIPLVAGSCRFQPVYVGDVAQAVRAVLQLGPQSGQLYELGGPEILTLKNILQRTLAEIDRSRLILPMPMGVARLLARFTSWLPTPPLTQDQLAMLTQDNVANGPGLVDLGVQPTPLDAILPLYLQRFRRAQTRQERLSH